MWFSALDAQELIENGKEKILKTGEICHTVDNVIKNTGTIHRTLMQKC